MKHRTKHYVTRPGSPGSPLTHTFGVSESQGSGSVDAMSDAQLDAHFAAEYTAGVRITRLTVDSTSDSQFTNQHDRAVAQGLQVIAVIAGNTSLGTAAYATRASWAATTFPGMKIEMGNEWNLNGFTPAQAASYQIAAYPAIKAASPNSVVVSNGLAAYGNTSSGTTNQVRYLEGMYANGLAGYFDELGIHPYYYANGMTATQMLSTSDIWSAWMQLNWTTPSLRSVMTANGDVAKKITATEWGAPADDASVSYTNGVTQTEQANLMTQGIAAWKTYSWARDLLVYGFKDIGVSPSSDQDHFGMVNSGGTAKPSLAAFTAAV